MCSELDMSVFKWVYGRRSSRSLMDVFSVVRAGVETLHTMMEVRLRA